jgi:hypothetical protein
MSDLSGDCKAPRPWSCAASNLPNPRILQSRSQSRILQSILQSILRARPPQMIPAGYRPVLSHQPTARVSRNCKGRARRGASAPSPWRAGGDGTGGCLYWEWSVGPSRREWAGKASLFPYASYGATERSMIPTGGGARGLWPEATESLQPVHRPIRDSVAMACRCGRWHG